MKYYINKSEVKVFNDDDVVLKDQLPHGIYKIDVDQTQLILRQHEDIFSHTDKKIYGDLNTKIIKIIDAYNRRDGCTGIILTGERGNGKTEVVKQVAHKLYQDGVSIIIVDMGFNTERLVSFLNTIDTPYILIIDEFEKIFSAFGYGRESDDRPSQEAFLTFLDGIKNTKSRRLVLLTCNDIDMVNPNLFDRPGRILYHFRFNELSDEIIEEYCQDNLDNKDYIENIKRLKCFLSLFSFDILKELVIECNSSNVSPEEALTYLNVSFFSAINGRKGNNVYLFLAHDIKNNVEGQHYDSIPLMEILTGKKSYRMGMWNFSFDFSANRKQAKDLHAKYEDTCVVLNKKNLTYIDNDKIVFDTKTENGMPFKITIDMTDGRKQYFSHSELTNMMAIRGNY